MTKSELDQIGQSLLSQYNINTIAQQAIDAAARHGLTLTGTEIKDIPVRVTMHLCLNIQTSRFPNFIVSIKMHRIIMKM